MPNKHKLHLEKAHWSVLTGNGVEEEMKVFTSFIAAKIDPRVKVKKDDFEIFEDIARHASKLEPERFCVAVLRLFENKNSQHELAMWLLENDRDLFFNFIRKNSALLKLPVTFLPSQKLQILVEELFHNYPEDFYVRIQDRFTKNTKKFQISCFNNMENHLETFCFLNMTNILKHIVAFFVFFPKN